MNAKKGLTGNSLNTCFEKILDINMSGPRLVFFKHKTCCSYKLTFGHALQ